MPLKSPDEQAQHALELRHRAEALRATADAVKDPGCYAELMRIAASYDVIAQGVEHTLEAFTAQEPAPAAS